MEGQELEVKGGILETLMELRHLKPRTLWYYSDALARLSERGDLDDVGLIPRLVLALPEWMREHGRAAYRHHCRRHRLPEPRFKFSKTRRKRLSRIPPDRMLQASIAVPRLLKWRAYLRLLYEVGARPSEMRVRDVDLER